MAQISTPALPTQSLTDDSLITQRRQWRTLLGFVFLIGAGLLVYSQTMAFVWDEGFHLLAAQLIDKGKVPYVDFCFPQTPLNAYWNAFWLALFHQSWRITHVWTALEITGATFLAADYTFRVFPIAQWRLVAALAVAAFIGLNEVIVQFGNSGQAYAIGLLLTTAAFRLTVAALRRESRLLSLLAGLSSGAAAACTLLTAPVTPVLLAWLVFYSSKAGRWAKAIAFAVGTVIPFAPVIALWILYPRQVFFNVIQYQALFRRVKWEGATTHDIDVLSAWLDSTPALLLGSLGIAGFLYVLKRREWDEERRREIYLSSALVAALALYIATAHPTFQRYFLFAIPFASIVAAVGLFSVAARLWGPERPRVAGALVLTLLTLAVARSLFDDRDSTTWRDYQKIAAKVASVTPKGSEIYVDELVYFLLNRTPPFGMEFSYAHKLDLPPAQEKLLHIVSEKELNEQVKNGQYYTVQTCKDDRIDEMRLPELFPNREDIEDCSIFWGKVKPLPPEKK